MPPDRIFRPNPRMSNFVGKRQSFQIQPYAGCFKGAENMPLRIETQNRILYNLRIGCILNQEVCFKSFAKGEEDDFIGEEGDRAE